MIEKLPIGTAPKDKVEHLISWGHYYSVFCWWLFLFPFRLFAPFERCM